MKVILTSNIKKLGKIGELVSVKNGFARNFLLPQNKALRNNKKNLGYFETIKKDISEKENIKKENAENLLKNLKKIKIEFFKECDENDQLYGAVSKREIQNYLIEKDIKLLSDDIQIANPIKSIGKHSVIVNPYEELTEEIFISIKKAWFFYSRNT